MQITAGVAGNWSYNASVAYTCEVGYNLTTNQPMICSSDGSWHGMQPVCELVTCQPPTAPNNGSYVPQNATYNFTNMVEFTCRLGFDRIGPNSSYCTATGQWSENPPECQIKDCGNLTDPTHGQVVHTRGTILNQTAYYSCREGYTLNGTDSRTCNEFGNWTLASPTCDVISKFFIIIS